jgi:hypothetical protein
MGSKVLITFLLPILLSGCDFGGGPGPGVPGGGPLEPEIEPPPEEPSPEVIGMGSGRTCRRRLAGVVDEQYLAERGLEVKEGKEEAATIEVGGAIAEVCAAGPRSLPVDHGAQRVVEVLRKRYAD